VTTADRHEERGDDTGGRWPLLTTYLLAPALVVGLMVYYLLLSKQVAGEWGFPLDDSWIHVRFAQNLAAGYGFSFNPGEPTSTTTAPVWTLLLTLAYRVTHEYLVTSAVLNGLLCVLVVIAAGALARTIIPDRRFGAAVSLVVAATVPLPWFALSGMEPPLYIGLSLLGLLAHVHFRRARDLRAVTPTVIFALAALSRPECLVLFPLAMLDRLLFAGRAEGGDGLVGWLRQLALHTPIFLAVIAPVFLYNYSVMDRPLPSSYYVKAQKDGIMWALVTRDAEALSRSLTVDPLRELSALLRLWARNNFVLVLPFFIGLAGLVHQVATRVSKHKSVLILLALFGQPVAWAVSAGFEPGPAFQSQRYVANLGPLYLILGMAGGWWLLEALRKGSLQRIPRGALMGAALLLVLVTSLTRQPAQAMMYARNVRDITQMHVRVGRWVRDHIPREAYLALNDIGAITMISGCRVFDMQGLATPEVLDCIDIEHVRAGTSEDCQRELMRAEQPDYMISVCWPREHDFLMLHSDLFEPVFHVELSDNITAAAPMMVVYQTDWCRHPPDLTAADDPGP